MAALFSLSFLRKAKPMSSSLWLMTSAGAIQVLPKVIKTPHLDHWPQKAFTRSLLFGFKCLFPHAASVLTGRNPYRTGVPTAVGFLVQKMFSRSP